MDLLEVLLGSNSKKSESIWYIRASSIVFSCLSIHSHKLVVTWLSMSPFDPYVAKWVLVSSHLNPNSDLYFGALGSLSAKKLLKMFGHLDKCHAEFWKSIIGAH